MKDKKLKLPREALPTGGIVAFSLCSTASLYHLFADSALHPSALLWLPASLIELVTAWVVYQVVGQTRELVRSRISKQDRRFHTLLLVAFALVASPLVATSVWANTTEFGGSLMLGLLFPIASIGSAVGAALPSVAAKYEKRKSELAQAQAGERKRKQEERKRKQEESKRQAEIAQAQADAIRAQALGNLVASLGKAGETLRLYAESPLLPQAQAAQALGISRQAVGQHLRKLEQAGIIKRNGNGVEVLV